MQWPNNKKRAFSPPTPSIRLKVPPPKTFTLRAVISENLPRPIAPADDRPTSRIWHSIIASARGVAWLKKIDEGTSMRPRYDGAYVATRLAFRSDGRISGQRVPIPTRPSSIRLFFDRLSFIPHAPAPKRAASKKCKYTLSSLTLSIIINTAISASDFDVVQGCT